MAVRVLLVDDHKVVRDGLRALLNAEPDLDVIGDADDGRSAVRLSESLHPDVVVMDLAMPDLNGIDATRQIVARSPQTRVVVLSANLDRQRASAVLSAGAMALVPKEAAFEELAQAIRAVVANRIYLSPQMAGDVVGPLLNGKPEGRASAAGIAVTGMGPTPIATQFAPGSARVLPPPRPLTPREREVLQLMAEGKATKEVAAHLDLSVKTVETHRRQIMEKLNLYSVAELTKYAVREGLTVL
jgi:DNA-binding NarL/FixJ family response regulator